jgi:hypothetical protein
MNSGSAAAGVEGQVIEPSPKLLNTASPADQP